MKNRTPRKLKKKKAKKGILIYDLAGLPEKLTMKEVLFSFLNKQIVVWDSCSKYNVYGKANPPTVVNNLRGVRIVDLSENNSKLS